MHLKAYAVDGATLRTGSANFSTSGQNVQDHELIVICDDDWSADQLEAHFERMWQAAAPMIEFGSVRPSMRWSRVSPSSRPST